MARTTNSTLTAERARELFCYEPETGKLYWRNASGRWGRISAGTEAGTTKFAHGNRYRGIQTGGRNYLAHRIAWLIVTGEWPEHGIDHIDGDGLNNRLKNLRDVTHLENHQNCKISTNNKSGVMGVDWHTTRRKWHAQIKTGGINHHLGLFDSLEDAVRARQAAEVKHGFHENHGRAVA